MKYWTVVVFSAALALTYAGGAARAVADNLPVNFTLSFDGFCDGMHLETLTTKIEKSATGWLAQGARTGCASGDIVGVNVSNKNLNVTIHAGGRTFLYVIRVDHTWANYFTTGGGARQLNAGTWSLEPPGLTVLNTDLPASTEPQ